MVQFGVAAGALTSNATAAAAPKQYIADQGYHHVVQLRDLKPATRHWYRVGSPASGWSDEHSFVSAPAPAPAADDWSFSVAMFGDMGWSDSMARYGQARRTGGRCPCPHTTMPLPSQPELTTARPLLQTARDETGAALDRWVL